MLSSGRSTISVDMTLDNAKESVDLNKNNRNLTILAYVAFVVIVATIITLCDYFCHTRLGVLKYSYPDHGISLFTSHPTLDVFLGFVGMSIFCALSGRAIFFSMPAPPLHQTLGSLIVFVGCYYASGVFQNYPMLLHNSFLAVWAIRLTNIDNKFLSRVVAYSAVLGIAGPLVEGFYSSTIGFFAYVHPHAYHVPMWLCPLYLNGGIAVASTVATLEALLKEGDGERSSGPSSESKKTHLAPKKWM